MSFRSPSMRQAYRRGVWDTVECAVRWLDIAETEAMAAWLSRLEAWAGGEPPPPPVPRPREPGDDLPVRLLRHSDNDP